MRPTQIATVAVACLILTHVDASDASAQEADGPPTFGGVVPRGDDGQPLNLGFETGTLEDWTAEGEAFEGQPIRGDTVSARRSDMSSDHVGDYWIGGYEKHGDAPTGRLVSVPFEVTHPFASFLVGGGRHRQTRVELILANSDAVLAEARGHDAEDLERVAVDLSDHLGDRIQVRLIDTHSGGWGHVNFDDFRFHAARPDVPERPRIALFDASAHEYKSPEEAAAAMTVPEGFVVTAAAGEPDVIRPIAFTIDDRGRLWVLENHTYPRKAPPGEGKDRILIFEDTDGDGKLDERKVFYEGLNMATGLEVGFGGAWVGAAPELLFIPDEDGDDVPDGAPEVLLDGWGLHDTHETLNSFIWGPDGWLYGCHGVFTHSNVGKPGTPDDERIPINAGVWRYHPQEHVFEVFAHGTSNPWGVDFDQFGNCFIEACVIPHLFHMVEGGRFQRQAGQHFNPYTYEDIKTIADHAHYQGDIRDHAWWGRTPEPGEGTLEAGGGHAHAGLMVYQGGKWPEEYHGSLFMNNIHGARLNRDVVEPRGSGFNGRHADNPVVANDPASQILALRYGPDGDVWMIDWYDFNQCHRADPDVHDPFKGRIFKLSYGEPKGVEVDLAASSDEELLTAFVGVTPVVRDGVIRFEPHESVSNAWYDRHARRILQERGLDEETRDRLARLAFEGVGVGAVGGSIGGANMTKFPKLDEPRRLRVLWTLHSTGGLDAEHIEEGLKDEGPYVRAWTIRLALEDGEATEAQLARFAELAANDPSPVVRLALASAARRLPVESEARWAIVEGLARHEEDAADHNLPLMDWYALEPLAAEDPERALSLASESPIPVLLPFTVRRIGALGSAEAIALLVERLGTYEESAIQLAVLQGLQEALQGRRRVAMPEAWPDVSSELLASARPEIRSRATALALTFGDASARRALLDVMTNTEADADRRLEALEALRAARVPELAGTLRHLIEDPDLGGAALRALAEFEDPEIPEAVLDAYPNLSAARRRDALNTLAARPSSARALLEALEAGRVASSDLTADIIRQMRNLGDEQINERIAEVWGTVRESTADKQRLIAEYEQMLNSAPPRKPDVALGRAVFERSCAQCHRLFGAGEEIGPDLTGSNRADLDYLLSNVLDPSAAIGKDYQAHLVATADGRILTGLILSENENALTLATANETVVIPADEVEARRESELSMMPDDLLANLSEHEVRSLAAYLASPAQTPLLATPETAGRLFNGEDLTGWFGDEALWSVEDGELVGRSDGLEHNAFLQSELIAEDFELSFQVKLVPNSGNSGTQFRSEPRPGGEVAGYQADIGEGWWGKLYEEHGRGLLWDQSGEEHVKPGDWNGYRIVASGSRIRTFINGEPCVDLNDPDGRRRGIFALQLHAGPPMEVRFRNFELVVPAASTASGPSDEE